MILPPLCTHHHGVYTTRAKELEHRFRHPGRGRKALYREAQMIARQCPQCVAA